MQLKDPRGLSKYHATGVGPAMLANRISHFYDLRGPSLTLDTACSSGLYSLHLACQGLKNGEATTAIVSGCNVIISPDTMFIPLSSAGFLSPDGQCHSFDQRANGYARGEGLLTFVLKSVTQAIDDGDTIRAIIRGTGLNQDGRTPSITQPSTAAQVALIKDTYARNGLDMTQTRYFEAHGTGTVVGDPTEFNAIATAFAGVKTKQDPLFVSSVKNNIGHLEGASGLAGLLKSILILEHAVIPPHAHFERLADSALNSQEIQVCTVVQITQ